MAIDTWGLEQDPVDWPYCEEHRITYDRFVRMDSVARKRLGPMARSQNKNVMPKAKEATNGVLSPEIWVSAKLLWHNNFERIRDILVYGIENFVSALKIPEGKEIKKMTASELCECGDNSTLNGIRE